MRTRPSPAIGELPRDDRVDSTPSFLRDPYRFISTRSRQLGSDAFETRLALRPVICLTGTDGAALFYDERFFIREGVLPEPVQATLFGRGGVQMLDGDAHRHRKAMFRRVVTGASIDQLVRHAGVEWQAAGARWASRPRVQLYDEAKDVLARAVCAWAGVPLGERDAARVGRDLAFLFEGPTTLGPTHLMARLARWRLEGWLGRLIGDVRSGGLEPPAGSALDVIARHRELDGSLLPPRIAAVELLSVLRPTVAVSVFVVFTALVLHRRPEWRDRVVGVDSHDTERFVQEVRRFHRFAPFVAARVREDFTWQGHAFPSGRLTLLDLYGIDHDPRVWPDPERFDPDRFHARTAGPFELVPQGGGDDPWLTHRCAGEAITVELLKGVARFLASELAYDVPEQDLRIPRSALPGLPRSRFVMGDVRPV